MYKKLTTQPRNAAQVHSVRVEAVGGMSTGVDSVPTVDVPQIEAVSEMSTGCRSIFYLRVRIC